MLTSHLLGTIVLMKMTTMITLIHSSSSRVA